MWMTLKSSASEQFCKREHSYLIMFRRCTSWAVRCGSESLHQLNLGWQNTTFLPLQCFSYSPQNQYEAGELWPVVQQTDLWPHVGIVGEDGKDQYLLPPCLLAKQFEEAIKAGPWDKLYETREIILQNCLVSNLCADLYLLLFTVSSSCI